MAVEPDNKLSFSYNKHRGGEVLEALTVDCGEGNEDVDVYRWDV